MIMITYTICLLSILIAAQACFAQGQWTSMGAMPTSRYAHTVNELNGKLYVVGGANTETGVYPRTAFVYDTSSGTWTQVPLRDNTIRAAHTSCVVGGKLYVVGGNDSSQTIATMDMFDPGSGQWVTKPSMSVDRGLAACAPIGGKIYVFGGMRFVGTSYNFTGLRTGEVYDTTKGTWTPVANMPTGRWGHSAAAVNGKIYIFGGRSVSEYYSSVEVYDPQTNTWSTKSNMPTFRYCLTTCVLDSLVYAVGGWAHSGTGPLYDKVEVYDPERDRWYTETPMPVTRAVLAGIVLDGKIFVYGGSRTTHPLFGTSDIYRFQPGSVAAVDGGLVGEVPGEFTLEQNYPNPFNPRTVIRYGLPTSCEVRLGVYDVLGREVCLLVDAKKDAGVHDVTFDGSHLASGVYLYRLQVRPPDSPIRRQARSGTDDFIQSRKLILVR